ncbi:MAG: flagellar biosynthesis anti-sigma factor FlgM [Defluviitaleaceae bacterium]|nr:flagellar biosynthesis anti-sigma factor FlgM [Defluviitaleaceae bacterium]
MRINNIANIYETYARQQSNSRVRQHDAGIGEGRRDSLAVSSSARSFTAAMQAIANAPDVREELVADIRARIDNGTYAVDAAKIADRLLG